MHTDLHIHTTASDGCWTPEQVVIEVQARGIGLFAIADHDSIASVPTAEVLALEAGLTFLRGVEISTLLEGHLFHVLAYGFDLNNPAFALLLQENKAKLLQTNEVTLRLLVAAGYEIDLDDYAAYEHDRTRGGWKALNFLIDRGFCTDVRDYFENLTANLPTNRPAFPHPTEAIPIIRGAGGVPILAHPGVSLRHVGVTGETLRPLLDSGIAGLECYSHYHDEATTRFCLEWCNRHDLLITGGSDCHGGFVGRELGVPAVDIADLRLGELEERIVGSK
ncbi:MAG: PHP domain-containing protein [Chloroflexota bacterium]|nr:PHP domain-containing protein [Chloroflexota bacterium]